MEENKLMFQGKQYRLKRLNLKIQNNTVVIFDKIKAINNPLSVQSVYVAVQERRKLYITKVAEIDALPIPENMKAYFKDTESNLCISDEMNIKDEHKKSLATPELYKSIMTELLENGNEIDFDSDDFDAGEFNEFFIEVVEEFKKKRMN